MSGSTVGVYLKKEICERSDRSFISIREINHLQCLQGSSTCPFDNNGTKLEIFNEDKPSLETRDD
jgi:hypothetical protein